MMVINAKLQNAGEKGVGLFAEEFIPKHTIWWVETPKFDKIITREEYESYDSLQQAFCQTYSTIQKNGTRYLCVDNARFINHSDVPNTGNIGEDCWTLRDIQKGEELTCDYKEICEGCSKDLGFENKE